MYVLNEGVDMPIIHSIFFFLIVCNISTGFFLSFSIHQDAAALILNECSVNVLRACWRVVVDDGGPPPHDLTRSRLCWEQVVITPVATAVCDFTVSERLLNSSAQATVSVC